MNRVRYEQILELLEDKFEILNQSTENLEDGSGGSIEIIEFEGPLGRMKLEFTEKARFIGEKASFSNRVGSGVGIEKQFDQDDQVAYLKAFTWNDASEAWVEVETNKLTGI